MRPWLVKRRPRSNQGTNVLFLVLLALDFSGGRGAAKAQSAPAISKAQICGVTRAGKFRHVAPVYPAETAHSPIAAALEDGFRKSYLDNTDAAANIAHQLLAKAALDSDTCTQALSSFLLASTGTDLKTEQKVTLLGTSVRLFDSLQSASGVGYSELRLANLYSRDSKYEAAAEHYRQASLAFDSVTDHFGSLYVRISAVEAQRAPDFAGLQKEADSLKEPCLQALLQEAWSNRSHLAGDLGDTIAHADLADAFYKRCPGSEATRAAVQTNLGRTEREQGRPAIALEHYRIALRLQQRAGELTYVPQTYNAMAVAYENMHNVPRAIFLYQKALRMARLSNAAPMIEFLEANLGTIYVKAGQPKLGIPLLLSSTANLASDRLRCIRLEQLGYAYDATGDTDAALSKLSESLAACRKTSEIARILQTLEVLSRAELHASLYDDALRDANEAIALLDRTRSRTVLKDAYKQGFFNDNLGPYHNAIAALTALHRPSEALEVAEQGRARAFLDLLASHASATAAPIAPHTFEQYRKDMIESSASADALSIDAMRAAVARLNSTLVAYWLSPNTLYIWIAPPGQAVRQVSEQITPAQLGKLVAATRLPSAPGISSAQGWRTLYRLLISPVEESLPSEPGSLLTIVPSGPLFALSFSALASPGGAYLTERFRTHTIPSVGMLAYTRRNAEAASQKTTHYLLVGSPDRMPNDLEHHALSPLPGTSLEVNAIAKLIPADNVTRLEGPHASASELRLNLPNATSIHFATHAILNDADPYDSFLALDNTRQNGRLSTADIYALHLNSRLVVLSACSSGLGKVTGDGVEGMSRAFFYAGSASVLNTMWDITDRPTAELLPRFYNGLLHGESPSAALRGAQLSMLNDLRHHRIHMRGLAGDVTLRPDPIYWAAFSLVGEP